VTTIPQKELRNSVGEVLRRAEAGERFTITVAGRPVAELGPARALLGQRPALEKVFDTPAPRRSTKTSSAFPARWSIRSSEPRPTRHSVSSGGDPG